MPTDPHLLVATVIAAVAFIRSRMPKIDGPWVLLVAAVASVLVSFAAGGTAKPLDNLLRAGWLLVAAVGGMSGLQWAAAKMGGAVGTVVASSMPPPAGPSGPVDASIPKPPRGPADEGSPPLRVSLAGRRLIPSLGDHRAPALLASMALALALWAGCGYGKTACTVVDIAHQACTIIRYMGPDGKPHDVPVSREELELLAKTAEARKAAAK